MARTQRKGMAQEKKVGRTEQRSPVEGKKLCLGRSKLPSWERFAWENII